jgi:hypothetical protein
VEGLKVKSAKHGIKLAKNLFGGSIEEELEEISGKKVISVVEKVKLFGKNNEEKEIEAKIDTGAFSTSLDEDLAREIGFGEVIDYFEKIEKPQNINRGNGKQIMDELKKEHLKKIEDLIDIDVIYSSSGVTIRPKIKVRFIMDNELVVARANIIKRDNLKYPMIVGRRDLKKFLVEA